jgi:cbb3-type cytochrome oxidase subunit 3
MKDPLTLPEALGLAFLSVAGVMFLAFAFVAGVFWLTRYDTRRQAHRKRYDA